MPQTYQVEIADQVRRAIKTLPGNMRPRIVRVLRDLETEPRPSNSRALQLTNLDLSLPATLEARRIRLEQWRLIYVLETADQIITAIALRKRPPYRYEDLAALLADLQEEE